MCFHRPSLLSSCPLPPASASSSPLHCTTASPCSCCKPLIGTTLTTGCWWNSLLLFIKQSALDLFILTPSFTCLAMEDWKDWSTSIEKSTCSPSCSAKQCFQRAFSSCKKPCSHIICINTYYIPFAKDFRVARSFEHRPRNHK